MWVTKLLISQVKKRIFCPKTTKFGPKLAFLVDLGQAMQAFLVPCWSVSWWLWRAGCISQDTYILYCFKHRGVKQDCDSSKSLLIYNINSLINFSKLVFMQSDNNIALQTQALCRNNSMGGNNWSQG